MFWQLVELGGQPAEPVPEDGRAAKFRLNDADRRVTGYGGVNQLTGPYELNGKALKFGQLAMTRRAGPEPLMRQESALTRAMSQTASWRAAGPDEIELLDAATLADHPQLLEHDTRLDTRTPSPLPMLQLLPLWSAAWPVPSSASPVICSALMRAGGSAWAGLRAVFRSRYLTGIAGYIVLMAHTHESLDRQQKVLASMREQHAAGRVADYLVIRPPGGKDSSPRPARCRLRTPPRSSTTRPPSGTHRCTRSRRGRSRGRGGSRGSGSLRGS